MKKRARLALKGRLVLSMTVLLVLGMGALLVVVAVGLTSAVTALGSEVESVSAEVRADQAKHIASMQESQMEAAQAQLATKAKNLVSLVARWITFLDRRS